MGPPQNKVVLSTCFRGFLSMQNIIRCKFKLFSLVNVCMQFYCLSALGYVFWHFTDNGRVFIGNCKQLWWEQILVIWCPKQGQNLPPMAYFHAFLPLAFRSAQALKCITLWFWQFNCPSNCLTLSRYHCINICCCCYCCCFAPPWPTLPQIWCWLCGGCSSYGGVSIFK